MGERQPNPEKAQKLHPLVIRNVGKVVSRLIENSEMIESGKKAHNADTAKFAKLIEPHVGSTFPFTARIRYVGVPVKYKDKDHWVRVQADPGKVLPPDYWQIIGLSRDDQASEPGLEVQNLVVSYPGEVDTYRYYIDLHTINSVTQAEIKAYQQPQQK